MSVHGGEGMEMQRLIPIVLGFVCAGGTMAAFAGPPFRTDDPQPVEHLHWEFYLASVQEFERHTTTMTAPHFEANFGALPDLQLHILAPLGYVHEEGGAQYGYSDTEIGVKYRFVEETQSLPQVGVFPLVEIPTGNEIKGLGSGRVQVFLPLWLQKSWGNFTTYGGAGWWYNPGVGRKNWVFAGWEAQYDFSENVTLGGELYYQTADSEEGTSNGGINVGGVINVSEEHHILFSVGRTLAADGSITGYIGYQITV
jgi:hypothetical protein